MKKFNKIGIIVVFFLSVLHTFVVKAEILDVYLWENDNWVNSIDGNIFQNDYQWRFDRPYVVVRHMGNSQLSTSPTFPTGDVTGYYVVGNRNFYERGYQAQWPTALRGNSYQMQGANTGIYLDSRTFPKLNVVGGGPHAVWSYLWSNRPMPWLYPDRDLTLQARVTMPIMEASGGGVGQLSFVIYLQDVSNLANPKWLAVLVNLVNAPGGNYTEQVMHDHQVAFASSPLRAGQAYLTKSPYSQSQTSVSWSGVKLFRAHISRQNLINIINKANLAYPQYQFSTNPMDYELAQMHVLAEMSIVNSGANVRMGLSIQHVLVLSCSNLDCTNNLGF